MASSNRHWPSMFKSKPRNTNHHQCQPHDQIISSGCNRNPYTPGPGCEERTPEPKPRWNPRPEQIRILESIFNSGMVNPPRDEIRKIRAQLQEYGQVGDSNVFYWFQNRKSRSKHKQRQLHNAAGKSQPLQTSAAAPPPTFTAPSSSSSSSDKTSSEKSFSVGPTSTVIHDLLNSPTASVNQPLFQAPSEFLAEPFFYSGGGSTSAGLTHGFGFPEVAEQGNTVGSCQSNFLLSELMLMSGNCSSQKDDDFEKLKEQHNLGYNVGTNDPNTSHNIAPPSPITAEILQGVGEHGPTKSTVFINDVCFEVGVGPFSVREAFGYDAVLIHSSGQPVLTNEWGVTLQPLQHGAFYYLLRPFTTPSPHDRTIDLI